jgi:hypothetical protein
MMQAASSRPTPAICVFSASTSASPATSFCQKWQVTQSGACPVRSGSIAIT